MSFIINAIKEKVVNSVSVNVLPEKYSKFPVLVTDTSNSMTAGWSLTYNVSKSKYEDKLVDFRGRFSEIVIANASALISDLEVVFGKFRSGENVKNMYNTQTATYETPQVWYTVTQRSKGVNIAATITDEGSPFHMLQMSFFIMNESNGRHPLVGHDTCLNVEANTWTDRRDSASLAPSKRQYIPIRQEDSNSPKLAKVSGSLMNGLVAIDTNNTEVDYMQNYSNERRLLAGLYEEVIMEHSFEIAKSKLPTQNNNFGGFSTQQQQQQPAGNAFAGGMQQAQQNSFVAPQQQQQVQQNTFVTSNQQQPAFAGANQQQQHAFANVNQQQPAFAGQQQSFAGQMQNVVPQPQMINADEDQPF